MKIMKLGFKQWLAAIALLGSQPMFADQIGLQLWSLRHQMEDNFPNAVSAIADWGIHAVEGGGNLYGLPLSDFKAILDRHHIQLVSVDTHYEELRDNPIAVAYKAKFFGARFATFYWIPHDGSKPFTIDDAKATVDIMNKAGKILSENGIQLQYHPHGYEFHPYEDGTILDYMLTHVEHASFQMDVFWIQQAGHDPVDFLNRYPGVFTTLHLKDRKPGTPNSMNGRADVESNVVIGTGDIDIDKIVAIAKRQQIPYLFIEDESSAVLQQVPESIKYLNALD